MSYNFRVLYDNPLALWSFDSSLATLPDLSGNGLDATATTPPAKSEPIVALGIGALRFSQASNVVQIPVSSIFSSGYEKKVFSFEAWVKPQSTTNNGWLFKRNSGGIRLSNGEIRFILPMQSSVEVVWTGIETGKQYHIVGVYDTNSACLYVNGVLVAQQDITPENLSYGFPTETASSLTIETVGSYAMVVDSPAIYNYTLVKSQVAAHYAYGTNHNQAIDASGAMAGNVFDTFDGWCDKAYEWVVDTAEEWNTALFTGNVVVTGDTLETFWTNDGANYGAGTWVGAFSVDAEATTTVGSRISWVANKYTSDYTVESSLDGTSWSAVTNGGQPFGAVNLVAGQTFYIRVTFTASSTVTTISKLRVAIYRSKGVVATNNSGVTLSLNNALNIGIGDAQTNACTFGDNAGYLLAGTTSKLTIPQDATFGGYKTIEFFARWDADQASKTILSTAEGATVATNGSGQWTWSGGASVYVDGVLLTGTPTPSAGIWHHVVVIIPTTTAGAAIGNNSGSTAGFVMRVTHISALFNTLTASQILALYQASVGYSPVRTIDGSLSTISEHTYTESGNAYLLYTYNWSISGSG